MDHLRIYCFVTLPLLIKVWKVFHAQPGMHLYVVMFNVLYSFKQYFHQIKNFLIYYIHYIFKNFNIVIHTVFHYIETPAAQYYRLYILRWCLCVFSVTFFYQIFAPDVTIFAILWVSLQFVFLLAYQLPFPLWWLFDGSDFFNCLDFFFFSDTIHINIRPVIWQNVFRSRRKHL